MTIWLWLLRAVRSVPAWLWAALAALALIVALLLTIHLKNNALAEARADNAVLRANVIALETDARAKDQAAQERAGDTIAVDALRKDLTDAIKDAPFTAPGAATVLLGCQRLRNAGVRAADLPAACRSDGGK